jgi:hypothetical protein
MKSFFGIDQAFSLIKDAREMQIFNNSEVRQSFEVGMYELRTCWYMSKMTMLQDASRQNHMFFVEFLEYLCRVAWLIEPREISIYDKWEEIGGI